MLKTNRYYRGNKLLKITFFFFPGATTRVNLGCVYYSPQLLSILCRYLPLLYSHLRQTTSYSMLATFLFQLTFYHEVFPKNVVFRYLAWFDIRLCNCLHGVSRVPGKVFIFTVLLTLGRNMHAMILLDSATSFSF